MSRNILFLYTGGRAKRIQEPEESYAKDFFYGFHEFKKRGFETDFVERVIPDYKPRNLRYRWLDLHNNWAAKQLTMGNNAPFFLPHLNPIKKADIIISIGDSISLAPEYYKLRGWIDAKIIHVSMGMANYWRENEAKGFDYPWLVEWYYKRLLKQAHVIVTLGEAETQVLGDIFPKFRDKIRFIPFGVDVDFWTPSEDIEKDIDILFIGNDMRRDYELAANISNALPQLSFAFVSKHMNAYSLGDHVTYHNGSWRDEGLTDLDILNLYRRARLLINPIKPTFQPSGQSVTLQAMACGLPVLISKFEGFWELDQYNDHTISFVDHNSVEYWIEAINSILKQPKRLSLLSENGRRLTLNRYSSEAMVKRYVEIVNSM